MLKKLLLLFFIGLILLPATYAQDKYSSYNSFYAYNKQVHGYDLINLNKEDIKALSNKEIKHYKTAKKLNKLYTKGKHREILNKYPDFTPSLIELYRKNYNAGNYDLALYSLNKIKNSDKTFDKKLLASLYFLVYYKTEKYDLALRQIPNHDNYKNFYVFIADCYLNLKKYTEAILYSNKIPQNGDNYYMAQTILFKAYFRQNKLNEAKNIAQNLINMRPYSFENYLRYARCEDNETQKIKYYYIARNKAKNINDKNEVNSYIIFLEQKRLDNTTTKLNLFVEKPNWIEVLKSTEYGDFDYWISRQDNFFKSANECIQKYAEQEQAKCFEALNKKQDLLTMKLIQTTKVENERAYQEIVVRQNQELIRQQMIQNINQINANYQMHKINNSLREQNYELKKLNNFLYW